jgi:eukaryotic-like serine/threonine-protein kinase
MGEVYRASDTNLGRPVAIKVLPHTFARDADRLARFEREAKTLASLNHPNIAQVFGLEKGTGDQPTYALVMELVEGPTLADRIAAGPIPLDEAVPIAIQIAEALETAHDQGIIHRDLKPANVKVRIDGTVKVLDFGLAKAMEPGAVNREPGSGSLANSPTITSPAMTQAGMILGTAAYMSPEQAKGRVVDRRADIWAFGCVLFEMLTGRRAFAGDDISDLLVSVLRDEPAWSALPAPTPPHIRTLLRRCLEKDLKKRLPQIGAARLELAEGGTTTIGSAPQSGVRPMIHRATWAVAGGAVVAMLFTVWPSKPVVDPVQRIRFEIEPPPGGSFPGGNGVPRFAISPDGQSLVYQADSRRRHGNEGNRSCVRRRRPDDARDNGRYFAPGREPPLS